MNILYLFEYLQPLLIQFFFQGAVYQTTWSPFDRDVFLSCSADWTVKLWHCEKTQPVLSLQSASVSSTDSSKIWQRLSF